MAVRICPLKERSISGWVSLLCIRRPVNSSDVFHDYWRVRKVRYRSSYEGARKWQRLRTKHCHICGQKPSPLFSMPLIIHIAVFRRHSFPHIYDDRGTRTIDQNGHFIQDSFFVAQVLPRMPHNAVIHTFCKEQSMHARRIGLIDTLTVGNASERRKIVGGNTDWSDLYAPINRFAAATENAPIARLVVGGGTAYRTALYALYQAGIREIFSSIVLLSRPRE